MKRKIKEVVQEGLWEFKESMTQKVQHLQKELLEDLYEGTYETQVLSLLSGHIIECSAHFKKWFRGLGTILFPILDHLPSLPPLFCAIVLTCSVQVELKWKDHKILDSWTFELHNWHTYQIPLKSIRQGQALDKSQWILLETKESDKHIGTAFSTHECKEDYIKNLINPTFLQLYASLSDEIETFSIPDQQYIFLYFASSSSPP